jgi:SAM-dependent methyltransferase/glycosyltransferase involved in cell wall biosynthesis
VTATFDFGMIVFNAEFLLVPCLEQVYDFAHRILIVEGATRATTHYYDGDAQWITSDGHSTDRTVEIVKSFPDPDKKIILIQREGFWDGKTQMCNAYVPYVEADYVWQLDSDEFYHLRDLLRIQECLTAHPENTAVHFYANHFWGDWDHVTCGRSTGSTDRRWANAIPWRRIFRHEEGSRWASHEPPVYLSADGADQNSGRLLSRDDTRAMGIELYHYSYVTRDQAFFKTRFFGNTRTLPDWEAWQTDHSREVMVRGTFACEFKGEHPEVIRQFISRTESRGTGADAAALQAATDAPHPRLLAWDPAREFELLAERCANDDAVQLALRHLPPKGRVLAAGSALVARYLLDRGYEVEAYEYRDSVVQQAAEASPGLKMGIADLSDLAVPDGHYDALVSLEVAHRFVAGVDAPLSEHFRVLAPGGIALITVPSHSKPRAVKSWLDRPSLQLLAPRRNNLVRRLFGLPPLKHSNPQPNRFYVDPERGDFYEYRLRPREFEAAVRAAGFTILTSEPIAHMEGLHHAHAIVAKK